MDNDLQLLSVLVSQGKITQEIAENIKITSINSGDTVGRILLQKNLIDEETYLQAKSQIENVPYISLSQIAISPDVLTYIPEPVARKYKVIPFELDSKTGKLKVAMIEPLDLPLIEFLEQKSGKEILAYLASENSILEMIETEYATCLSTEVTAALKDTAAVKTIEDGKLSQIIKEAPIAKIVSTILEYAVRSRASDVHIEPQETKTRVRYRIDGILHEKLALPKSVNEAVISRIKILSDMKIDERRIPQDGRFNFKLGNEEVDLRVSTLPTVHGEKVVMRLLKKTGGIPDLPELGLRGISLNNLQTAITRPHGIILVSGPTGSGKTTSLYSVLSKLNTEKVNIVTL